MYSEVIFSINVRYKCCGNVVVFLAFRYVALALALGVVALFNITALKST